MLTDIAEKAYQYIEDFLPRIPVLILTLLIGYLAIKIVNYFLVRILKAFRVNKALVDLIMSLVSILLWFLLAAEIARQAGLPNLAITISGSVVALGFAIASGASALTSDIIAGFFLAKDKDFECGYKIKVGEIEGIIDKIDIRKVRVIDDKKQIHVIPNSKIDNTLGWTILDKNSKK